MYFYHWLGCWLRILSNRVHGLRCRILCFGGSKGLGCYGGNGLGCWLGQSLRILMLTFLILDNQICQVYSGGSHLLQQECHFGENVLRNLCSEGRYFIRWHRSRLSSNTLFAECLLQPHADASFSDYPPSMVFP